MKTTSLLLSAILVAALAAQAADAKKKDAKKAEAHPPAVGYTDTPMLPGGKWHVHDPDRPQPRVVTPGTFSTPTTPGQAPSDAILCKPKSGDIFTKDEFGDIQLHLEFATPTPPHGESQERGNSGVFLFGKYELQILDSYQNRTYADGSCASIYGQYPPLVNASRPPGEWQTYDVVFT